MSKEREVGQSETKLFLLVSSKVLLVYNISSKVQLQEFRGLFVMINN